MGLSFTHYRNRTARFLITVTDADGDNVVLASGDVVRVKIGRGNATPLLDLDSAAATANGSSLTAANPSTLLLVAEDSDLTPGIYDIEVAIVDASDGSGRIKHAESGTFIIHDTPGGDTGLT